MARSGPHLVRHSRVAVEGEESASDRGHVRESNGHRARLRHLCRAALQHTPRWPRPCPRPAVVRERLFRRLEPVKAVPVAVCEPTPGCIALSESTGVLLMSVFCEVCAIRSEIFADSSVRLRFASVQEVALAGQARLTLPTKRSEGCAPGSGICAARLRQQASNPG